MRPVARHLAGERELEIHVPDAVPTATKLGDWRTELGYDFSGKVLYVNDFDAVAGDVQLDLGMVKWACSVKLNGVELPAKFIRPFRWTVPLKAGRKVLEATVANTLANAVSPDAVRDRIARDSPPRSVYDVRQTLYDRENQESGLFGPVTISR